jgi:glycosyltransferase involved in cell wall biosynthesis
MSVSVVIPAYNAGAYLHKALESILRQTVPVDEVIVVDDGSADNTCEVARSFGERVRVLTQPNQGPSAARNLGVQEARSELIAFLDADDQWLPEKIEKQLAAMKSAPEAILCYTSMIVLEMDGSQSLLQACPLDKLRFELRRGNPRLTPTCIMLYRSAFLEVGGFPIDQIVGEDWDLWCRLIEVGPFCIIEEPTAYYQASNTGLSSNADELYREARRMVKTRLLVGLRGMSRWTWRRKILSFQAYQAGIAARTCHQRWKEIKYLGLSTFWWPFPFWIPRRLQVIAVTLRNLLSNPSRTTVRPSSIRPQS